MGARLLLAVCKPQSALLAKPHREWGEGLRWCNKHMCFFILILDLCIYSHRKHHISLSHIKEIRACLFDVMYFFTLLLDICIYSHYKQCLCLSICICVFVFGKIWILFQFKMLRLLLTRLTKFARDNCQSWIITWLLNIQILNSHINVSQHNVTCSLPKYCPNIAPNSKNPLRLCQRSHLGRCFSFDGLLCLMLIDWRCGSIQLIV